MSTPPSPPAPGPTPPEAALVPPATPAPEPLPSLSPSGAAPAPPAAHSPKQTTSLSPSAQPYFPHSSPGRSKAMRWSEESNLSDSDYEVSPAAPSFAEVIRQGSLVPEDPPRTVVEPLAETVHPATGEGGGAQGGRGAGGGRGAATRPRPGTLAPPGRTMTTTHAARSTFVSGAAVR